MCPANALFYCGDTSQTIARGIGFRFIDILTLFHDEMKRRQVSSCHGARLVPIAILIAVIKTIIDENVWPCHQLLCPDALATGIHHSAF